MCDIGNQIRLRLLRCPLLIDELLDILLHTIQIFGDIREFPLPLQLQAGTEIPLGNLLHCTGDRLDIPRHLSLQKQENQGKQENSEQHKKQDTDGRAEREALQGLRIVSCLIKKAGDGCKIRDEKHEEDDRNHRRDADMCHQLHHIAMPMGMIFLLVLIFFQGRDAYFSIL